MIKKILLKKPQILFIHIPKTAGTSFRVALEKNQKIEKDYGKESKETTDLIDEHCYKQADLYRLKTKLIKKQKSLAGHVPISRYADFYDIRNIITFVREPLAQIVSHYNHQVTYCSFEQTFPEFYTRPNFINSQAKQLQPLPLSLIGFLGITEHFNESLSIINKELKTQFQSLEMNKKSSSHKEFAELEDEEIKKLTQLNTNDIALYQKALLLHKERMSAIKIGVPWVHLYAQFQPDDQVAGCAYFAHSNDVVEIEILFNGVSAHKMKANQFTGLYPKFNFPRERYVGFHWLPNKTKLKGLESCQIRVLSTGQIFDVSLPPRFKL